MTILNNLKQRKMKNPNQLIEEAEGQLKKPLHNNYNNIEAKFKPSYKYGVVSMNLAIQLAEALEEIKKLKTDLK